MQADPLFSTVTLGEVRGAHASLTVRCPSCGHMADINPMFLRRPDEVALGRLADALRCRECGRKGGQGVMPEPRRWVWHLRRTGQRSRMPFWEPMIPDELEPLKAAPIVFPWRRTWPDEDYDFLGEDASLNLGSQSCPGSQFGRVHPANGPQAGRWSWSASGTHAIATGYAATAAEAALLAENAYRSWKAALTPEERARLANWS